jgi:LacI family transcriptional regulator
MAKKASGKEPTAQDVADLAGVSRTAVSFVVNNKAEGSVSDQTRQRILEAASKLGYQPNPVARSLRIQRTHMIGLVTDRIASSPFAGQLLSGATERALQGRHLVAVFDSAGNPDRERDAAKEFRRRRVDGLIYAAVAVRELAQIPDVGLPTVLANCFVADDRLPAIIPDDKQAGIDAAEFLIGVGHRRIAMITGDDAIAGPWRRQGFEDRLAEDGCQTKIFRLPDQWTIDAGYHAASRLLGDRRRAPTAVFCVNDRVAAGALLAAARLGLAVPGDVSILGFDDQEELAPNLVPALTTFALPHRSMGEAAVDLLLARLGEVGVEPMRHRLPCPLVIRQSVGPAPTR